MAAANFFDRVLETTTTTGTGTLTLAGAVTGYQTFAAVGDGNTTPMAVWEVDSDGNPSGAWEVADACTYTASGTTLTRGTFKASSTGSAINFGAGTKYVALTVPAFIFDQLLLMRYLGNAGIRLTLTQGTAVTTSDVTGATSIYAEPMNGGLVPLFSDAAGTMPIVRKLAASSVSLALGTLASGTIPNDVFAYDNSGTIALEKLPWTNTTTRATAVDLVGGRYYKNSDYTRLLVGTFTPLTTTTTEDSVAIRHLWNAFNQQPRRFLKSSGSSSHTHTGAYRAYNNDSTTRIKFTVGIAPGHFIGHHGAVMTSGGGATGRTALGYNSTTVVSGTEQIVGTAASAVYFPVHSTFFLTTIGDNYIHLLERSDGGTSTTFDFGILGGTIWM